MTEQIEIIQSDIDSSSIDCDKVGDYRVIKKFKFWWSTQKYEIQRYYKHITHDLLGTQTFYSWDDEKTIEFNQLTDEFKAFFRVKGNKIKKWDDDNA